MFLWPSSNGTTELYQSIAEKTKHLAQKCNQQKSPKKEGVVARDPSPKVRLCACKPSAKPPRRSQSRWYVKQPTWRLWGEEKVDGAIYTVYLKKVRYHRPTRSANSDSDDEISHLEWETVRVRFVKAGTVEKLVEALATDDGELETTYVNVFLATYRSFTNARRVLELLLKRYETLAASRDIVIADDLAEQHRKTLVLALHVWLDTYPEDFREPPNHPTLQMLLDFTQVYLPGTELHTKALLKLSKWKCEPTGPVQPPDVCLAPGMRVPAHHTTTYSLPHVPHELFAQQLTRMDTELFKKLVPHQCLGAEWGKRGRASDASTVRATVDQFNALSFRVISTILVEPKLRYSDRAAIITAWIDIAQELRILKNFSSLKAIVSALQQNPVYRLQKTWSLVPKEKVELFDELARIFSEENNQWAQRAVLMREGTAKFADTVGENDKQLQKVFQKQNLKSSNISFGTIPFLGTFLTDLTMIDTAIPDTIADGLINFDKRRKEFEVLAQIKLLQGAANAYQIPQDPIFDRWFDSVLVLDDKEANKLSNQIEPQNNFNKDKKFKKGMPNHNNNCHKKNDSIASTSSSNSSQFYCETDGTTISSKNNSLERGISPAISRTNSSSSIPSLDVSLSSANSANSKNLPKNGKPHLMSPCIINSPDFYIIKVTYEANGPETDGVVMYKSIMLSNNERTPQVIRNSMLKLNLEGNPDAYTLSQVLPDKEMLLPDNANVYYAVNTAYNLNFILRPKSSDYSERVINGRPSRTKK